MKMNAQDVKTFPKFSKYVSTSLPGMASVKSIISAIESISEFGDTAAIKAALSWGRGPMVEVKILVDKQVGHQVVSPRAGHRIKRSSQRLDRRVNRDGPLPPSARRR